MNLHEEYSDEEIESIKNVLTNYLDKFGIQKTLDLLIDIGDIEFWKNYENENGDNPSVTVVEYDTDKEDCDDGYEMITSDSAKKVWKVFSNDSGAQEIIADAIDDIDYDSADDLSRMNTVCAVYSTVNLLATAEDKGSDKLYDSVKNKMYDLEDVDFCKVCENVDTEYFFEDPNFSSIIHEKIKNMETKNFIYFMLATQESLVISNKFIINTIKSKVESLDDKFVNNVYKSLKNVDMPKANISKEKVSKIDRLIDGIEDEKEALEIFSSLSDSEIVKYLLSYEDKEKLVDPKIMNSKEFTKKLEGFSDENVALLVHIFEAIYSYALELEENDETRQTKKSGLQWEPVIKEAQKRNMLIEDFKLDCSEECFEKMLKLKKLHNVARNIWSFQFFSENSEESESLDDENYYDEYEENEYSENEEDNIDYSTEEAEQYEEYDEEEYYAGYDEYEDEYDDYNEKYNENSFIFDNYKEECKDVYEFTELYDYLDKLEKLPNIKILHIINHHNVKNQIKPADEMKDTQLYFENYLKTKILDMPIAYASFFHVINNGPLNDAIEVKTDEMQQHLLYNQHITDQDER